jgi:hypothetical protein
VTAAEIGLGRIQQAVTLLMFQNLNAAIVEQDTVWSARDATFYAAMGRENPAYSCEPIAPDSFYVGTIPSLMKGPPESYPNCSVIAYMATPIPTDNDWAEMYNATLAVELLVKGYNEHEVNARIQRTVEAAHSVLISDKNRRIPDADGTALTPQISNTPTITIGDVFVGHGSNMYDASEQIRWYWQGGRLQYQMERFTSY